MVDRESRDFDIVFSEWSMYMFLNAPVLGTEYASEEMQRCVADRSAGVAIHGSSRHR